MFWGGKRFISFKTNKTEQNLNLIWRDLSQIRQKLWTSDRVLKNSMNFRPSSSELNRIGPTKKDIRKLQMDSLSIADDLCSDWPKQRE